MIGVKKLIFLINNPLKYSNISYEGKKKNENNFKVQKLAFDTLRLCKNKKFCSFKKK